MAGSLACPTHRIIAGSETSRHQGSVCPRSHGGVVPGTHTQQAGTGNLSNQPGGHRTSMRVGAVDMNRSGRIVATRDIAPDTTVQHDRETISAVDGAEAGHTDVRRATGDVRHHD